MMHVTIYFFSREIASAIKLLLDAVNRVINEVPTADNGSKQVGKGFPQLSRHRQGLKLQDYSWFQDFGTN